MELYCFLSFQSKDNKAKMAVNQFSLIRELLLQNIFCHLSNMLNTGNFSSITEAKLLCWAPGEEDGLYIQGHVV